MYDEVFFEDNNCAFEYLMPSIYPRNDYTVLYPCFHVELLKLNFIWLADLDRYAGLACRHRLRQERLRSRPVVARPRYL